MIIRTLEVCPRCGQYSPWRKYSTRLVAGERRIYVKCCRCGARDVVIYRLAGPKFAPTGHEKTPHPLQRHQDML